MKIGDENPNAIVMSTNYLLYSPFKGDHSLDDGENYPEGGVDDAGQRHRRQRCCQDAWWES